MKKTNSLQINEQQKVEKWFDKTYETRATQYLRPVVAYELYLTLLDAKQGKSFLDVACGIGQMLKAAEAKQVKLTGIDLSRVAVEQAKQRFEKADIRKGNAENLPYAAEGFDYITCLGSLERMLDANQVLSQMHKVLEADGKMCILVRNSERASWKFIKKTLGFINKDGHQGAKNLTEWSTMFEANNFEIERIHHDQWPRNRWIWWLSLGGNLFSYDFSKIQSPISNIEKAYEFIFILRKKT